MSIEGSKSREEILDERMGVLMRKARKEIEDNLRTQELSLKDEGELEERADRILARLWFAAEQEYAAFGASLLPEDEVLEENIRTRLTLVQNVFLRGGNISDITAQRLAAVLAEKFEIVTDGGRES